MELRLHRYALALVVVAATACATAGWQRIPPTPAGVASARAPALLVTLVDGTTLTLRRVSTVGDTLCGYTGSQGTVAPIRLPLRSVRAIEVPKPRGTLLSRHRLEASDRMGAGGVLLGLGAILGILTAVFLITCHSGSCVPLGGH